MNMSERLEKLGEILQSYKNDIKKILEYEYGLFGEILKGRGELIYGNQEDMIRFTNEVDIKYAQIRAIMILYSKIDEMYREFMMLEEILKEIEKREGGKNEGFK